MYFQSNTILLTSPWWMATQTFAQPFVLHAADCLKCLSLRVYPKLDLKLSGNYRHGLTPLILPPFSPRKLSSRSFLDFKRLSLLQSLSQNGQKRRFSVSTTAKAVVVTANPRKDENGNEMIIDITPRAASVGITISHHHFLLPFCT